eukprot:NODE_45_length_27728_cov_0.328387.p6 type:complete len:360 gc:universal NODE_45_length_27728_cov_0.328387:16060-14981(-)
MSKRQTVKRKPIDIQVAMENPKIKTNAVFIEKDAAEPRSSLQSQKKISKVIINKNDSEAAPNQYLDVTDIRNNSLNIGIPSQTSFRHSMRAATKSSVDEDSESQKSLKRNSTFVRHRNHVLKDFGKKISKDSIDRCESKSNLFYMASAIKEKKIESDEIYKLRDELRFKDNEIERLKQELKNGSNKANVQKCTIEDYKTAILMSQEILQYSSSDENIQDFEIISRVKSLFEESKEDTFLEVIAGEYKSKLEDLYNMLKVVIQKNLVLNEQLRELGLHKPTTLIEETEFSKFVTLYEILKPKEASPKSEAIPKIKDIESKLKEQVSAIECSKWEREYYGKDIESGYLVFPINLGQVYKYN